MADPSRAAKKISQRYQYYYAELANPAELRSLGQDQIVGFWYNSGNQSVGRSDSVLSNYRQERKEKQTKQPKISPSKKSPTVEVSPDEDPP